MRKPTAQEQADAWHHFAFSLNFARCVSMNHEQVIDHLKRVDAYVNAHSDHNGERPQSEITKNVNHAFWTHIAQKEPPELPKRGRPRKVK